MNDIYMSTQKTDENINTSSSNTLNINGGASKKVDIPEKALWNIINSYFESDPYNLVKHHIDSYDDFMENGISKIIKENNPIKIRKNFNEKMDEYDLEIDIFMGGVEGNKLYFGKPIIYEDPDSRFLFPNEARLRDMNYMTNIHMDIDIIYRNKVDAIDASGNIISVNKSKEKDRNNEIETNIKQEETITLEKMLLGRFPIMLHSKLCVLRNLASEVKFQMGECRNDKGGYFIIDGKEKAVMPQEKFADNMMYIKKNSSEDTYKTSCIIRTVSENASKPERTLKVSLVNPSEKYSNLNIVVDVPNIRAPVPLFILMRALGVLSDKDIIETCLLNMEKYEHYIDLFRPSVHDAGMIFNQEDAIDYLAKLTKRHNKYAVHDILMNYFLPNIGEENYITKAYYLGHMVFELLQVSENVKPETDRDSFRYKRVELPGDLLYNLFKEYYVIQKQSIFLKVDKQIYYHHNKITKDDLNSRKKKSEIQKQLFNSLQDIIKLDAKEFNVMMMDNKDEFFKDKIVETGMKKAMKGNWGATSHSKKMGIVQDLNRLSFNSGISHLRKLNLPLDASAKVVGPRLLHSSQYGIIDGIDTPDGGNIGLHKHLAIMAHTSTHVNSDSLVEWLERHMPFQYFEDELPKYIDNSTKLFVNGRWIGIVQNPFHYVEKIKQYRRIGCLPWSISVAFHIGANKIEIFSDTGRLSRPVFYTGMLMESIENKYKSPNHYNMAELMSLTHNSSLYELILKNEFNWEEVLYGTKNTKVTRKLNTLYNLDELYGETNQNIDQQLLLPAKYVQNGGIIDIIDSNEVETSLMATYVEDYFNNIQQKLYTHVEIHPSINFGVMGNQIIYPENNPVTRNSFSCGQSKQAVSVYHSNFENRFDKMGVVLNYGQIPLIKSRYLQHIQQEQHPYGENTIVAIMCYSGYNVEDAVLINKAAVERGLFRTSYYSTVKSRESSSDVEGGDDSMFYDIQSDSSVKGKKLDYDFSKLDEDGIIREGTIVDERSVLIGKVIKEPETGNLIDASVYPKKGLIGIIDKVYISTDEEGFRLAKIRIREERIPAIGDKMASRAGQKGTIGILVPQEDMPFTRGGIVPDIIINPHAIPSRMTLGQLVEMLFGKTLLHMGGFGDCTAFVNQGPKHDTYGTLLEHFGYNKSGTELLYNGFTGDQLESNIYIGPTYYMRLKHMVKDKINHRGTGPRQMLTRQTVQGRANDGGLRIGEMERDGVIAHGATAFLRESFMIRGDDYKLAICNHSGTIAVYNIAQKQFYSLYADGYIKYNDAATIEEMKMDSMTQQGRSFSIINIPYSLKLLIQELQTMNVQMRLITDDNMSQNSSMLNSDNLQKLMKDEHMNWYYYLRKLDEKKKMKTMIPSKEAESVANNEELENSIVSEAYVPVTPEDYIVNDIQEGNNNSIPYAPEYPNGDEDVENQHNSNVNPDTNENKNQKNVENAEEDKIVPMEELENSIKETNNTSVLEPIELNDIDNALKSKEDNNSGEKRDNNESDESNSSNGSKQLEDLDLTKSLKITKV